MTHRGSKVQSMPPRALRSLTASGENLRVARTRRGWSMDQMAASMMVTRKTLARLEKGDPGVSLFVLQRIDDPQGLAEPGSDTIGLFYEKKRLPRRVRKAHENENLDF